MQSDSKKNFKKILYVILLVGSVVWVLFTLTITYHSWFLYKNSTGSEQGIDGTIGFFGFFIGIIGTIIGVTLCSFFNWLLQKQRVVHGPVKVNNPVVSDVVIPNVDTETKEQP